jgi:hypothetical protein
MGIVTVFGIAVLLVFLAWVLRRIIVKTDLFHIGSILGWGFLFIICIGLDLFRTLEGIGPSIASLSDLVSFAASSLLIVFCIPVGLALLKHSFGKPCSDEPQTVNKPELSSLRRFVNAPMTRACVLLGTALAVTAVYAMNLLIGASYAYGMAALPDNKNPSGLTLPQLAVQTNWLVHYDSGPLVMEPWSIADVIRSCLIVHRDGREYPAGSLLARRGAQLLLKRKLDDNGSTNRFLQQLRSTVIASWVSRHWSAEQVVRTDLAESYYGNAFCGFAEASMGFLGCSPRELQPEDIALLVGILSHASRDHWYTQEDAEYRLGLVLRRLEGIGAALPDATVSSRFTAGQRGACKRALNQKDIGQLLPEHDLMKSSYEGNRSLVKHLLDSGTEINSRDRFCRTALMRASCRGHQEIVTLLLERGADVNCRNGFGWTALMSASLAGREVCVKLLLDKGAAVNVADNYGETAQRLALANGHVRIAELLKAHGAKE